MKSCPICDFSFPDDLEQCPRHGIELTSEDGPVDPLIGTVIRDKYKISQLIGRGSMGTVYRASQFDDFKKDVAIKVLHTHLTNNRESLKRFHHEAKAAQRLRHPHIVSVYDIGLLAGGQPYLAMEFLEGETLQDFLKRERKLPVRRALPIIRQVCEALVEAHSHGVIHRDIKPANIMLINRFGEENSVVVVDFSIAKVIQRVSDVDSTTPGLIFGSPAYMSPERFMGKGGDFRSDIYSLGIIMFQMLAGVPPFRAGDLYALMHEHVKNTPPRVRSVSPDADVSEELELTIARTLFKRPEDRQQNVRQLLSEINHALDQLYNPSMVIERTPEDFSHTQESFSDFGSMEETPPGSFMNEDNVGVAATDEPPQEEQQAEPIQPAATAYNSNSALPIIPPPSAPAATPSMGLPVVTPSSSQLAVTPNLPFSAEPAPAPNTVSGENQRPRISPDQVSTGSYALRDTKPKRDGNSNKTDVPLLPLISAVAALALVVFFFMQFASITMEQRASKLINEGRLDDAGHVLQMWRSNGKLSKGDEIDCDALCLRLAKEYAKRRRYQAAVIYLNQISPRSPIYAEAKGLRRIYSKQQ